MDPKCVAVRFYGDRSLLVGAKDWDVAGGKALEHAFPRFSDDLMWWMEAAKAQRARKQPPY